MTPTLQSTSEDLRVLKDTVVVQTHQLMLQSVHTRATRVGEYLLQSMKSRNVAILNSKTATHKEELATSFHQVVANLQLFVSTFSKTHRFVFHLASMRRMYLDLLAIGEKLDHIVAIGGLEEMMEKDTKQKQERASWKQQLMEEREKEENELSVRAAKNALPFARNMMPHEPMEALTLLKFEIDFFKPGNSAKHVASMKKVFFSVVRSSNGRVAKIPEWYIPPYAVNYSRDKTMHGSVGTTHYGVWVDRKPPEGKKPEKDDVEHKPTTYNVAVKRLFIHADAIEFFRQEVETWFAMDHPNILKLYGASHCSRPALLVLEDATNGPLVEYLDRQRQLQAESRREMRKRAGESDQPWPYRNQRHALWSLFLQAAQGLSYLHEENRLVHSNLKSDNILVTADGNVKLTDFGRGMLELQNKAVQDKKFQELGWRAPNCRQRKLFRRPAFQDDIYSFGLCVLDALVPEISSIAQDKSPNGSKHVGDEGFNPLSKSVMAKIDDNDTRKLILGMCQEDPKLRLSLDEVITRLTTLRNIAANEGVKSSSSHRHVTIGIAPVG